MELKQAFWILRHGSGEGLREYLKAVKTIEDNCVPVVRCRDCRKMKTYECPIQSCGYDDFCSYGERRERNADR